MVSRYHGPSIRAAFAPTQLEAQLAQAQLQALKAQLHPHFLFNTLNAVAGLMREDVEAADPQATLHTGRDSHLLRGTLAGIETRLDPERFVRIHRSSIVNVDRVKELQPSFHGEYAVALRDGTRLHCSRTYAARLEGLCGGREPADALSAGLRGAEGSAGTSV